MSEQQFPPSGKVQRLIGFASSSRVSLAIIGCVAFLVYVRTLSCGFVWDDHPQIVSNPLLRSWHALPQVFLHHAGYEFHAPIRYYRPLYSLWSFLLFSLFRFQTAGWHLASVLLQVAVTCFVYWFARALKQDHWIAAGAAFLFAVHPVHVEVVSWLSAAADALATLFVIAAFLCFRKAEECRPADALRWKLFSCLIFFAALWSKESALAFAGSIFVYSWLMGRESLGKGIASAAYQALAYLAVTALSLLIRREALGEIAQISSNFKIQEVLLTLPQVLAGYIRLLFWPFGLNPLYEIPYVSQPDVMRFVVPLLLVIFLAGVIAWWAKKARDPVISFLGFWILLNLLPELYLPAFNPGEFLRDRYVYLSSVGFAVLIAKGFHALTGFGKRARLFAIPTFVLIAFALIAATVTQQFQWKNDLRLFERAARLNPQNDHAQLDFALVLLNAGDYGRARPILEALLSRHPTAPVLRVNLAIVYGNLGNRPRAVTEFLETLREEPDFGGEPVSKLQLARAYLALSDNHQAQQLLEEIWQEYPDYYRVAVELGRVKRRLANFPESEKWLRHDLSVEPRDPEAHCQLALTLLKENRAPEAEEHLRLARRLYPALACADLGND